jgi:hypothetical protein
MELILNLVVRAQHRILVVSSGKMNVAGFMDNRMSLNAPTVGSFASISSLVRGVEITFIQIGSPPMPEKIYRFTVVVETDGIHCNPGCELRIQEYSGSICCLGGYITEDRKNDRLLCTSACRARVQAVKDADLNVKDKVTYNNRHGVIVELSKAGDVALVLFDDSNCPSWRHVNDLKEH